MGIFWEVAHVQKKRSCWWFDYNGDRSPLLIKDIEVIKMIGITHLECWMEVTHILRWSKCLNPGDSDCFRDVSPEKSGCGSESVSWLCQFLVGSLDQVRLWPNSLQQVRMYLLGREMCFAITWAVWAKISSRKCHSDGVFHQKAPIYWNSECVAIRADFSEWEKNIYVQEYTFIGKEKFPECQKHNEIFGAFGLPQLSILEMLVNSYIEEEEKMPWKL